MSFNTYYNTYYNTYFTKTNNHIYNAILTIHHAKSLRSKTAKLNFRILGLHYCMTVRLLDFNIAKLHDCKIARSIKASVHR